MSLNLDQLRRRLRDVDYRIVTAMRCTTMQAEAYRSQSDAQRAVDPISELNAAGDAWFYRVTYRIKTLLGPATFSNPDTQPVIVMVDLNKRGGYPFTAPESSVIGPTTPWSPHFLPRGPVCFEVPGQVWPPDGSRTLGHLLLHLARLINFDENIDDQNYQGYNGASIQHWRTALKSAPITPRLTYPMLPDWYYGAAPMPGPAVAPAAGGPPAPAGPKATVVAGPPVSPSPKVRIVSSSPEHT